MYAQSVKATEQVAILDGIAPVSEAAGTVATGWISAANFQKFLAVLQTGVLGAAATVDAKFQQATSNAGAGAKDITGTAITQIVKATGDGKYVEVNLDALQLDVEGGFAYIAFSVTVGTAASEISAAVFGFNPRFAPASDFNSANVAQIVG